MLCSQQKGSLDFGVSLVMDPKVSQMNQVKRMGTIHKIRCHMPRYLCGVYIHSFGGQKSSTHPSILRLVSSFLQAPRALPGWRVTPLPPSGRVGISTKQPKRDEKLARNFDQSGE
jgi:hypothetical protein